MEILIIPYLPYFQCQIFKLPFYQQRVAKRRKNDVHESKTHTSVEDYNMTIRKSLLGLTAGAMALVGAAPAAMAGEFDGVTVNILTRPGYVIAGRLLSLIHI